MKVQCAACGFANPAASRFCGACGRPLEAACPTCGAPADPEFRFCNACGAALPEAGTASGTAAAEDATGPAAERRLVSVLFVDLVAFTALSERLDPEEVRELLGRYYDAARDTVARYDGTLEKFIGDAVMAVWGVPSAHEDDAQRAVRAGLELLAAVRRLSGATGHELAARAAVTTGEAAVTVGASGHGMVAGDVVNTCSRLQSSAQPDSLLADDSTRQAAGRDIAFEAAGALPLAGKSQVVTAWRAVSLLDHAGRVGEQPPFVGREGEIRVLLDAIGQSEIGERGRLVSVVGIPGIGKTRLAREVESRLAESGRRVEWYTGRAARYGEQPAFGPLTEIVRSALGLRDQLAPPDTQPAIKDALRGLIADTDELEWLSARLAGLLVATPEPIARAELFAAWRRYFERLAERRPLVLLLEDVQWAQPDLLDFIEYLAQSSQRHAVVIVTLARPELHDTRPTWGAALPALTTLHLDRLADDAIEALLAGLAPELSASGREVIRQRADGVPLYAVEMVRMLRDDGRLAGERLVLDSADVPGSLHALVAARVDGLSGGPRQTVLTASVLGLAFSATDLAAVTGVDGARLDGHLRTLIRREFLLAGGDGGRDPERLTFVQGLVRDICYRTLSRRERRARHLAAAARFRLAGDTAVDAVAEHLLAAHRASRDEPDQAAVTDEARVSLRRAAQQAAASGAPVRGLQRLEAALSMTPVSADTADDDRRLQLRAELLEEAGSAARLAARFDVAERHLREAAELRVSRGETAAAARDRAQLASLLLLGQRNVTALAELESAWAEIEHLPPDAATAELAAQLARAHLLQGAEADALTWADRAARAAGTAGADEVALDALITRGSARWSTDAAAGASDLERAIDEASAAGYVAVELRARNNLAWLRVSDDPRATEESARRGIELARRIGSRAMELQLVSVACSAAIETGSWEWAIETLDGIVDDEMPEVYRLEMAIARTILAALRGETDPEAIIRQREPIDPQTDPQLLGAVDYALAWAAFIAGRYMDAYSVARRAADRGLRTERFVALALAVRSATWAGDAGKARACLEELYGLDVRGHAAEAVCLGLRAAVRALSDETPAAAADFANVTRNWRELGLPLPLALCLLDQLRFMPVATDERVSLRAEGEQVLDELGAAGLRRRFDEAWLA